MKATGVVRRIDELGRIVIPKEIRKNMRIRDGESLEIFVDNYNQIILKKYSISDDYTVLIKSYAESLFEITKKEIIITDRNRVIVSIGSNNKNYINKEISKFLENIIITRNIPSCNNIEIVNGIKEIGNFFVRPIISNGDCNGLIILLSNDNIKESDIKIIEVASKFLGKYIEN